MPRSWSHSISVETNVDACGMPGLAMIPTTLMSGIQKEFAIALGAQNRTGDHGGAETEPRHRVIHAPASLEMQLGFANDPSFTHLVSLELELRLYQNNHFRIGGKQSGHGGQDHG